MEQAVEAPRKSYFAQAAEATPAAAPASPVEPAELAAASDIANAAPVAQTAPVAAPAPAPVAAAPAVAETKAMPALQAFVLPLTELAEVAQSSGLVWVNSDAEKIAAVQAAIAAEPQPIRVPRERPAPVQIDTGPLILVETKRDLGNMTLPFETNP